SFGKIDIGLSEHVADVFKADTAVGKRLWVDLNADRRLLLSADADQTYTRDLRELRHENAFGEGIDGGQRERIGGSREDKDRRVSRIHLAAGRRIGDTDGQK